MQCVKICGTVAKLHRVRGFGFLSELWFCDAILLQLQGSENFHFRCHSLSETRLQNRSESSFYTTIIVKKYEILMGFYTTWAYTLRF